MADHQNSHQPRQLSLIRKRSNTAYINQLSLYVNKKGGLLQSCLPKDEGKEHKAKGEHTQNLHQTGRALSNELGYTQFDQSPGATFMTLNMSNLSCLGDRYDMEALSKGMANAKITIKGERSEFTHKDKIFTSDKLKESDFKFESECQQCFRSYTKDRIQLNCNLCGESLCNVCLFMVISLYDNDNDGAEIKGKVCRICKAKLIIRDGIMHDIRKLEIIENETIYNLKSISKTDNDVKKVHREIAKMEECISIGKTNKQRELNEVHQLKEEVKILINEEKAKERSTIRLKDKETKKLINLKYELDQLQDEINIIEQAIIDGYDEIEEKN